MDIVEGKVRIPERPVVTAGDVGTSLGAYNRMLREYQRDLSTGLLLITNNISDEILDKVMTFSHPKDVWDELHRLYHGMNEDRLYEACLAFFRA